MFLVCSPAGVDVLCPCFLYCFACSTMWRTVDSLRPCSLPIFAFVEPPSYLFIIINFSSRSITLRLFLFYLFCVFIYLFIWLFSSFRTKGSYYLVPNLFFSFIIRFVVWKRGYEIVRFYSLFKFLQIYLINKL